MTLQPAPAPRDTRDTTDTKGDRGVIFRKRRRRLIFKNRRRRLNFAILNSFSIPVFCYLNLNRDPAHLNRDPLFLYLKLIRLQAKWTVLIFNILATDTTDTSSRAACSPPQASKYFKRRRLLKFLEAAQRLIPFVSLAVVVAMALTSRATYDPPSHLAPKLPRRPTPT